MVEVRPNELSTLQRRVTFDFEPNNLHDHGDNRSDIRGSLERFGQDCRSRSSEHFRERGVPVDTNWPE